MYSACKDVLSAEFVSQLRPWSVAFWHSSMQRAKFGLNLSSTSISDCCSCQHYMNVKMPMHIAMCLCCMCVWFGPV